MDVTRDSDEAVVFEALLTPNQSLGRKGFLLVMGALALLSFCAGVVFLSVGAWPVIGFLGLDVLLLFFAFRANFRHARRFERVTLTRDSLLVEQVNHYGRRRAFRMRPAFVRVELEEPAEPDTPLYLALGSKRLAIGGFLAAQDRADFARALRTALSEARRPAAL